MSSRLERIEEATSDDNDESASGVARLSPQNIASSVGSGVESLISRDEIDPDPEGFSRSGTEIYSVDVDLDRPDANTEDYYEEYQSNPVIEQMVHSVESEVFEAGYYVTADNDETKEQIYEFLKNMYVESGQTHKPFDALGKQTVRQALVRGTFLGEKMVDSRGRHTGINPLRSTTVEMYTKPGVNVLIPPDHQGRGVDDTLVKTTDDGDAAAYVQYDQQFSRWRNRNERYFARDEVVHWARKPDIGRLRGRSIVRSVYERSRALREKLQDNDLAIAMKAWPMVLFQLGTEDAPWTSEQRENFMKKYKENELGPGSFQGVPGYVDIYEFAGETADIEEHVQTDVDYVVTGMPGPRYALGAFTSDNANPPVVEAQERNFRKVVRGLRKELEELYTPYLRDVAESWDLDSSGLELHIGRPDGEVPPEDVQGSIIRYEGVGDQQEDDGGSSSGEVEEDEGTDTEANAETAELSSQTESQTPKRDVSALGREELGVSVMPADGYDELADPRLVSTQQTESELADVIQQILAESRDVFVDVISARYGDSVGEARAVSAEFESLVTRKQNEYDLSEVSRRVLDTVAGDTAETLRQHNHAPQIMTATQSSLSSVSEPHAESVRTDVSAVGSDIARVIREQIESEPGDIPVSKIVERVENIYGDDTLSMRAQLIARMNIQTVVNKIKYIEYANNDEIDGVTVSVACSDETPDVVAELAGCGGEDGTVALFDADESVGMQFESALDTDVPQDFKPLPDAPPYYYNDTSELVPVTKTDE